MDNPLSHFFPASVRYAVATPAMYHASLPGNEAEYVANAVAKRRQEFAAGRSAAREALSQLGYTDISIPQGEKREPVWPESITGSISHCDGFCAACVCRQDTFSSIGFDVEAATPLDSKLEHLICTKTEIGRLPARASRSALYTKLIFSAKESVYKCYYPINRCYLDFLDAEINFDFEENTFEATIIRPPEKSLTNIRHIDGTFVIDDRFIFTFCSLPTNTKKQ